MIKSRRTIISSVKNVSNTSMCDVCVVQEHRAIFKGKITYESKETWRSFNLAGVYLFLISVTCSSNSRVPAAHRTLRKNSNERSYHGKDLNYQFFWMIQGHLIIRKIRETLPFLRTMVMILTIYNLSKQSQGLSRRGYFHWRSHIAHFIDKNWSLLMDPKSWVQYPHPIKQDFRSFSETLVIFTGNDGKIGSEPYQVSSRIIRRRYSRLGMRSSANQDGGNWRIMLNRESIMI